MLDEPACRIYCVRQPANDSPHWSGSQAAHLIHVAPESFAVYLEFVDLLFEDFVRNSVEEDLDREDDHSQIVYAPEDRDVVGDDVTTEENVSRGADQYRLAARRNPGICDERPYQARVGWNPAGNGHEGDPAERAHGASRASPPPFRYAFGARHPWI
jgi:hypothetical protein